MTVLCWASCAVRLLDNDGCITGSIVNSGHCHINLFNIFCSESLWLLVYHNHCWQINKGREVQEKSSMITSKNILHHFTRFSMNMKMNMPLETYFLFLQKKKETYFLNQSSEWHFVSLSNLKC